MVPVDTGTALVMAGATVAGVQTIDMSVKLFRLRVRLGLLGLTGRQTLAVGPLTQPTAAGDRSFDNHAADCLAFGILDVEVVCSIRHQVASCIPAVPCDINRIACWCAYVVARGAGESVENSASRAGVVVGGGVIPPFLAGEIRALASTVS